MTTETEAARTLPITPHVRPLPAPDATPPAKLYAALVHAQRNAKPVEKDSRNEAHSYKYASAEAMVEEARAALGAAELGALVLGWAFEPETTDTGRKAPPQEYGFFGRKKLTIFFSDIVSFSAITDSVESELLSEVLNQYLNRMAEVAMKWGGTIDKFIGDAVMVFFGDSEFIDDATHARQCAKMALDMQQELVKLRSQWRELGMFHKLRVRMGINTGFCTVGNFGSINRMEYTIVGGQVNIASRLESIAEPDSIYISNSTFALIQDIAECEFVDDITVKGVHYPIEVYKLLALKAENAPASLFSQTEKNSFMLKEISFDHVTSSAKERVEIRKALNSAVRILEQVEQTDRPAAQ